MKTSKDKQLNLSDEARQARNQYQNEWRKKNPDKILAANIRYWEKKAANSGNEPIDKKIQRLRDQGCSLREIAAKVGINHVKVSRILNSLK